MLNPCNPCVCPGAPCEQCSFGYRSRKENHDRMKKLILSVDENEKAYGWNVVELYKYFHKDWQKEMEEVET